ncbi:MAG: helix-turn-helix domain-containing protein [Candidatus Woesearchaeota archaeon]
MANKNFLLLSLDDDKAKKVANAVSSGSCKKIIDYLASKDHATESDIAKELNTAISTVHYNLQLLMDSGLVESDEFHYSKKGKEVSHYKLANKYIIIAPQSTKKDSIREKLKTIFPVAIISIAVAAVIQLVSFFRSGFSRTAAFSSAPNLMMAKSGAVLEESAVAGASAMDRAAAMAPTPAAESGATVIRAVIFDSNIALWFLIGALSALAIYIVISIIKRRNPGR